VTGNELRVRGRRGAVPGATPALFAGVLPEEKPLWVFCSCEVFGCHRMLSSGAMLLA
jgi:hypothetical protein